MSFAPLAELQRLRSYSRLENGKKETWEETCKRTIYSEFDGIAKLGKLTLDETELVYRMQYERKSFGSARFLWVGGTPWFAKPENFAGGFNCSSFRVIDWDTFGMLMDLAMQGCGTGAGVDLESISKLPEIKNYLHIQVTGYPGLANPIEETTVTCSYDHDHAFIVVGDSRRGWTKAYQAILELSSDVRFDGKINVVVDLSHVRPKGAPLKGFGGVANPYKLPELFPKLANVLNGAVGRQLNSLEVCLLLNEAALVVVAGNIRRGASIQLGSSEDDVFTTAKDNLWIQDKEGNWKIDPVRDSLRMANHTRLFFKKPSLEQVTEAVTKQFYSGEGAVSYVAEAVARCNRDLLDTPEKKQKFLDSYEHSYESALGYLEMLAFRKFDEYEAFHRMHRFLANPCYEVLGTDFFCDLASVHLNQIDPFDFEEQEKAFKASALQASSFLQRHFLDARQNKSRELDPIVLISFTGAFTFFVKAFGVDWLRWWEAGRPEEWDDASLETIGDLVTNYPYLDGRYNESTTAGKLFKLAEEFYLSHWKEIVEQTVWEYCDSHSLKRPNRCTGIKPEGSLTLLSGVGCNGHHAPKSWRYIRRMTFAAHDPIALAAMDYGYTVIPGQTDKDEEGKLLNDPFDPRCTEWLVEVPVEEEIVSLFPDAKSIEPNQFSALAQFDWLMQVQNHYTTFNTSTTLEFRSNEIEPLSQRIYEAIQNDEGYVSAALLARFDANETFPRLPFEPITKEKYDDLMFKVSARRKDNDFQKLFDARLLESQVGMAEPQDSACGDGFCAIK